MASASSRRCSWYFASSERIWFRRSLWRSVRSIDAAGGRIAAAGAGGRMTRVGATRATERPIQVGGPGHLVAAWLDVADLRPRKIAALAQDPPPERERDLDPILEYESRARLEHDHRDEDRREGYEAKTAEGP